ncbi:unnamed protein product [Cuscuta europaea]|uniref:Uncharacterized protein n=1 Tax=Cuscuta europaea TaxID=41803 RepID=A0A9P1DZP0_CUSEU|nr:unnamed protein product [Cuscuta europaea]
MLSLFQRLVSLFPGVNNSMSDHDMRGPTSFWNWLDRGRSRFWVFARKITEQVSSNRCAAEIHGGGKIAGEETGRLVDGVRWRGRDVVIEFVGDELGFWV